MQNAAAIKNAAYTMQSKGGIYIVDKPGAPQSSVYIGQAGIERGNPDWLASSCRKGVRCDVLLVSGHFAGTEFYASRPDLKEESLPVDVLERAACSGSCPGLFENLKEVYLFGCDTLNSTPVRVAVPEMVVALQREGGFGEARARGRGGLSGRGPHHPRPAGSVPLSRSRH